MRRDQLHQKIVDRLERLPPPHQAHYGVVPLPPPESIPVYELNAATASAIEAIGRLDAIVATVVRLVQVGILMERTGYQKNRIFVAPDVLHILNRPFGTSPL